MDLWIFMDWKNVVHSSSDLTGLHWLRYTGLQSQRLFHETEMDCIDCSGKFSGCSGCMYSAVQNSNAN